MQQHERSESGVQFSAPFGVMLDPIDYEPDGLCFELVDCHDVSPPRLKPDDRMLNVAGASLEKTGLPPPRCDDTTVINMRPTMDGIGEIR